MVEENGQEDYEDQGVECDENDIKYILVLFYYLELFLCLKTTVHQEHLLRS